MRPPLSVPLSGRLELARSGYRRSMEGGRRPAAARLAITLLLVCACGMGIAASVSSAQLAGGSAPGGPGTSAYMDLARKDCFGTARNTTSKVWFTVADGVLSDVFSPTIENSNVNTVQYIVTNGKSFADLQQRNMTYRVSSPDRSGMVCRVVSTDVSHRFQLVSDYITDPALRQHGGHSPSPARQQLQPRSGPSRRLGPHPARAATRRRRLDQEAQGL